MSKIEKIRAEIERRKKICEGIFERESDTYYQGKAVAYGELPPFLDTLEEEPDKSLEEAAEEYQSDARRHVLDNTPIGTAKDAFIAGAEWQKEQMLKDTVEAVVTTNLANRPAIYLDQLKGFQYGDKVKLIIAKED